MTSHYTQREILETLRMAELEHFDVRTVTMGINLLDCGHDDPAEAGRRVHAKLTRLASSLPATVTEVAHYLRLLFAKLGADFVPRDGVTVGGAVIFEQFAEGADKGIGTEFDLTAAWDVAESTVLSAGLGYLFAGVAIDEDLYKAYWKLEYNY